MTPPRAPPLYRFVAARSGQSSVIGVVLILIITLLGTGVIVTLGSSAFEDTKEAANVQRTSHTMTLLDSRSAVVALGDARSQSIDLGDSGGGTYTVEENAAWLRIRHHNYTDSGDDETIYNGSLGSVTYETGDTKIAYEGGGVWRTSNNGTAMVSPPEFRYRDATLTLPVIQVRGDSSASGQVQASISAAERAERIYPNETAATPGDEIGAPYNATEGDYLNPVDNGTVTITVHSEHYQGWASYFRTRTSGTVSVDHDRDIANVTLETVGMVGAFEMPAEGDSLRVPAMASGHSVDEFKMELASDGNFQNMYWEMYYDTPTQQFTLHIHSDGQCTGAGFNGDISVSVYYSNGSGTYEGWQNQNIDPTDPSTPFTIDCSASPTTLTMDLQNGTDMTYKEIDMTGTDNKYYYSSEIDNLGVQSSLTLDDHPGAGEPNTYNSGTSTETLEFLIDHYFGLLGPNFELTIRDGPAASSRVLESGSDGELTYDTTTGSQFIQYLHVTENEVRVVLS